GEPRANVRGGAHVAPDLERLTNPIALCLQYDPPKCRPAGADPQAAVVGRLARALPSLPHDALFGCDPTPGIVSVDADSSGRARVWRRIGDVTEASEHHFANW